MKKYLFGLGAMLVGAGLMFVLMHGEVSADDKPFAYSGKIKCEAFISDRLLSPNSYRGQRFVYCKIKDLTCVSAHNGLSCVKTFIS